jgi:hypothetical protein
VTLSLDAGASLRDVQDMRTRGLLGGMTARDTTWTDTRHTCWRDWWDEATGVLLHVTAKPLECHDELSPPLVRNRLTSAINRGTSWRALAMKS